MWLTTSLSLLLFSATGLLYPQGNQRVSNLQIQRTAMGQMLRLRLASAPFPDPDRRTGYRYGNTAYPADPHYDNSSVDVLVPPGFHTNGPVNLVFFFHGWNSSIDEVQQRFALYRQFSESGAQALLVLPELAWNAPDSYGGKLEQKGGFARMVRELLTVLKADGEISIACPGNIVLTGHSGGYRVIARILRCGDLYANIKEVLLFDALYDLKDQYEGWIQSAAGKFVCVSAADGDETTEVNQLIASLRGAGVALEVAGDGPGTDSQTLRSRVLFLQSHSDHYGVVFDWDEFRRLLAASPLLRT